MSSAGLARALRILRHTAPPVAGGIAFSQGANNLQRASTGEDLPWWSRVLAAAGGAAGWRAGRLPMLQQTIRSGAGAGLATTYMGEQQKRHFGMTMTDPKSVRDTVGKFLDNATEQVNTFRPEGVTTPATGIDPAAHARVLARARQFMGVNN